MSGRRARWGIGALAALAAGGCELVEVTLADFEDVVVVEALVYGSGDGRAAAAVLLHRTVEGADGRSRPVPGATVRVVEPGGAAHTLQEVGSVEYDPCRESAPEEGAGTCYRTGLFAAPGDELGLDVSLPDGRRIVGRTRMPGPFELVVPGVPGCLLAASDSLEVRWTGSDGAWAYMAETTIHGLPEVLAPLGLETPEDPLYLRGLSVSSEDTTIVFPAELGIFERFELERELAVLLQAGLPDGTWAKVTVSAMDRNLVNWLRGGNFNPSGQVRIPSVTGEGTGFFGSALTRGFEVSTPAAPAGRRDLPPCG